MKENNKEFIDWVRAHKNQLCIAGISATTIIGIIIGLKNRETVQELCESVENSLRKTMEKRSDFIIKVQTVSTVIEAEIPVRVYTLPQEPFEVSQHIRNLSGGRHHSAEKAAEATALGIDLLQHQTLVNTYTKYAA